MNVQVKWRNLLSAKRARDHDGIPDWVRVLERQKEYEPYLGPRLVVDTFLAKEPVAPVVEYLS